MRQESTLRKMKVKDLRELCQQRLSSLKKADMIAFLTSDPASWSSLTAEDTASHKRKQAPTSSSSSSERNKRARTEPPASVRYSLKAIAMRGGKSRVVLGDLKMGGEERKLVLGSDVKVAARLEAAGTLCE